MKKIDLSLEGFPFKATFVITDTIVKKLTVAILNVADLSKFVQEFVLDDNFLDAETDYVWNKKTTMSSADFEKEVFILIFQHYYDEHFKNENFKRLIVPVQRKFKLCRKITVLFAEDMDDVLLEKQKHPHIISTIDNESTVIFPLFLYNDEDRPFDTQRAILALPDPVFIIPKTKHEYIETTDYTVDADVEVFKKPWHNKTIKEQLSLKLY